VRGSSRESGASNADGAHEATQGSVGSASDGGSATARPVDPIFQGVEQVERASPKATLLFQFFLFPLLIVIASVGVFLLFGAIGGSDRTPAEYLDDVVSGGANVQKQSVQQLAIALAEERRRVDRGEIPAERAFFAEPRFKEQLLRAFEASLKDDKSPARQRALAICVGSLGDPKTVGVLERHLTKTTRRSVRCAIVSALGEIPGEAPVDALLGAMKDPDDSVRNFAVEGLSRAGRRSAPAVKAALSAALRDESSMVAISAAAALALDGDDSGRALVAPLLDPEWVRKNVVDAKSGHSTDEDDETDDSDEAIVALRRSAELDALSSGIRSAFALRDEELKPKVKALSTDLRVERVIREMATAAIERWESPR